jgi:hypothetical protein
VGGLEEALVMSSRNFKGLLAPWALVVALGVVGYGCSSGGGAADGGAPSDDGAAADAHPPSRGNHPDAAFVSDTGTTGDSGGMSSGSTGLPCAADTDCMGTDICSTSLANGSLYPTPVCLSLSPCDLGDGTKFMFCDGTGPTDPNPPGICLATSAASTGLNGQCFPFCEAIPDGSKPLGCVGKDVCNVFSVATTVQGGLIGVGFCFGGCVADADCPTGEMCQKDQGLCLTAPQPATKHIGDSCTQSSATVGTTTTHFCECVPNNAGTAGICSQFCITGPGSPAPCPSGYVCDSLLPGEVMTRDGGTLAGFATQNPGLKGLCFQPCTGATDGGEAGVTESGADASAPGATDASDSGTSDVGAPVGMGACPTGTACTTGDTVGAVCLPQ